MNQTVADQIAALIEKTAAQRDKDLVKLYHHAKALAVGVDQLAVAIERMVALPQGAQPQPNGTARAPQANKRKPTVASDLDCEIVVNTLTAAPMTIKEIGRGAEMGSKTTGAALRRLVAEGKAVEKPRGKFSAKAEAAASEDGASA